MGEVDMQLEIVHLTRSDYVIFKPLPKILAAIVSRPITIYKDTYIQSMSMVKYFKLPDIAYFVYKGKNQAKYGWIFWNLKYIFNTHFKIHIECELASKAIFFETRKEKKEALLLTEARRIKKLTRSKKYTADKIKNLILSKCSYREFLHLN